MLEHLLYLCHAPTGLAAPVLVGPLDVAWRVYDDDANSLSLTRRKPHNIFKEIDLERRHVGIQHQK